MTRPAYDPPSELSRLPRHVQSAMRETAASQWLCVLPDGARFYLNDERRARALHAREGGSIFPPETAHVGR